MVSVKLGMLPNVTSTHATAQLGTKFQKKKETNHLRLLLPCERMVVMNCSIVSSSTFHFAVCFMGV